MTLVPIFKRVHFLVTLGPALGLKCELGGKAGLFHDFVAKRQEEVHTWNTTGSIDQAIVAAPPAGPGAGTESKAMNPTPRD
jgi:hypothetical protein